MSKSIAYFYKEKTKIKEYAKKNKLEIVRFFEKKDEKNETATIFLEMRGFLEKNEDVKNIILKNEKEVLDIPHRLISLRLEKLNLNIHCVETKNVINKNSTSYKKIVAKLESILSLKGLDYIRYLSYMCNQYPENRIQKNIDSLQCVGTALSLMHNIATYGEGLKCMHKNEVHVLESLILKSYNNAASCFVLLMNKFYDNCYMHIRSIGEINNLLFLFLLDNNVYKDYCQNQGNKFYKKYPPVKIRKLVTKKMSDISLPNAKLPDLPMTQDEYKKLSSYIHTDFVKQNIYDARFLNDMGVIGGVHQPEADQKVLGDLSYHVICTVILGSHITQRKDINCDDLFNYLSVHEQSDS